MTLLRRITAPIRWWRTTGYKPMPHGWGIAVVANMIKVNG